MFRLAPIALPGLLLALLLVPLTGFTATRSGTPTAAEISLLRFTNKLHAITLTSSDIAQSAAVMKEAYPDLIAYQTHVSVAGSRLNYLRLGFFANKDEARSTLATVRSWYPDAYVTQIAPLEQTTALGVDLDALAQTVARMAPASTPTVALQQPAPALAPPAKPPAGYALHLDVAANSQFTLPTLPPTLKNYHFYVKRLTDTQGVKFHLNLGVFADRNSAEQARVKLLARYPQAALREVTASEKTQVAALPVPPAPVVAAKPVAPKVPVTLPAPNVSATSPVPDIAAKTSAAVVATKSAPAPAPVVAAKAVAPEVAAKPVAPNVTVKPEAEKPAPRVVAEPAAPEIAEKPATHSVKAKPGASGANDMERQAQTLLDLAQDQIIASQFDVAVTTLAQILKMPKNTYTADAMEYTGLAYDQAGKAKLAIQNYQNFLRLYPDSRSGYRIRQRMQTLQKGSS